MSNWTYYLVFEPPFSTSENPDTVLRQRPGALPEDAEGLTRTGSWKASDLLALIRLGHNEKEVKVVDQARAAAIAQELARSGAIPTVPDDLAPERPAAGEQ